MKKLHLLGAISHIATFTLLMVFALLASPSLFAASIGPQFYDCFDASQTTGIGQAFTGTCTAESPFAQDLRAGNFDYLEFEDWEAIALNEFIDPIPTNTTGVTITSIPGHAATGVQLFTADQDDGVIDNFGGTGAPGYSAFGQFNISFDAAALGRLPTHVGFLAIGAGNFESAIQVDFYGPNNQLLGTISNTICPLPQDLGGGNCNDVSEDDLFYGFTDAGGIARVEVWDPNNLENILQLDHLQYGAIVPVPAAAWLFGSGLLCLVGMARRKKSA